MSDPGNEVCPRCGSEFETRPAILDLGQAASLFFDFPQIPPRVQCPGCKHVFRSSGIRYFGFIPPRPFRVVLASFVFIVLLFGAFVFLH